MFLFPFRLAWAWLYGVWERLFNRAVLGAYPPAMLRFRVSGTPSLLAYDLLGRETFRVIAKWIKGNVLDYGCGCGRVSRFIPRCDGLDTDKEAEAWCAAHLDGKYEGERAGYYDTVFCISILSHVDVEEAKMILRSIHSRLAIGGRLLVTTHRSKRYSFKRAKVFGSYFSTASYSEAEFRQLLDDDGFQVLEMQRFTPSPSQMMAVAIRE